MSGKYGLQLRGLPSRKAALRPLRPSAFTADDDEDNDVEREISRQAAKNKALHKVEEQHKKALAEDPSVFDYDGVFDEMKHQTARPHVQDRAERKPKYIEEIMKKCKERKCEQEIIYDRRLLKERSKDDHLYADKDKFVTKAYKEQLAEREKWLEEERLRQLREEKEDITKKTDLTDFYFSLNKNVAFGSRSHESTNYASLKPEIAKGEEHSERFTEDVIDRDTKPKSASFFDEKAPSVEQETKQVDPEAIAQNTTLRYKRSEDALEAAKERYRARRKTKQDL